MRRIFTRNVGRYKQGEVRDYPSTTWRGIESSVGKPLDNFTSDPDIEAAGVVTAPSLATPAGLNFPPDAKDATKVKGLASAGSKRRRG